jgi:IclR family transcriptional regulator, acetate operon repressor
MSLCNTMMCLVTWEVMAVKALRSAARVLATLEAVAEFQPVGVAELSRVLADDKSAVQRALVTLARDGWIRPAPGEHTRWELTTRILVVAEQARGHNSLRQHARRALELLRDETGESIILSVPDAGRIVAIDIVESRQMVRTAPFVGMLLPAAASAAGQAILAHMEDDTRTTLLGEPSTPALRRLLAGVKKRGWALNDGDVIAGATTVGAAVLDTERRPVAGISVSGPSDRLPPSCHARMGRLVAETAALLSEPRTGLSEPRTGPSHEPDGVRSGSRSR